jgi:hypothetical protein
LPKTTKDRQLGAAIDGNVTRMDQWQQTHQELHDSQS